MNLMIDILQWHVNLPNATYTVGFSGESKLGFMRDSFRRPLCYHNGQPFSSLAIIINLASLSADGL